MALCLLKNHESAVLESNVFHRVFAALSAPTGSGGSGIHDFGGTFRIKVTPQGPVI